MSTLWEKLTSFENLYHAATEAQRGKRFKAEVARFHHDIGASLVGLAERVASAVIRLAPWD